MGGRRRGRGRRVKRGGRKERGENFRKIGREGKKENFFAHEAYAKEGDKGWKGWRPTPLCQSPLNGCKLSVHFTEKILSSLVYRDLCEFCTI